MSHSPADLLFHAARFSLERLDWLAGDMRRALGLGRLPCLPFLARWQLRQLTRFLAQAEPLLRRLIVLMAADLGARLPVTQAEQATLTELHDAAVRENLNTS